MFSKLWKRLKKYQPENLCVIGIFGPLAFTFSLPIHPPMDKQLWQRCPTVHALAHSKTCSTYVISGKLLSLTTSSRDGEPAGTILRQ